MAGFCAFGSYLLMPFRSPESANLAAILRPHIRGVAAVPRSRPQIRPMSESRGATSASAAFWPNASIPGNARTRGIRFQYFPSNDLAQACEFSFVFYSEIMPDQVLGGAFAGATVARSCGFAKGRGEPLHTQVIFSTMELAVDYDA
jgi:hypothetical protein